MGRRVWILENGPRCHQLEDLKKQGKTIITTTHDERIAEMTNVVYRMDKGRLIGTDRQSKVDRP